MRKILAALPLFLAGCGDVPSTANPFSNPAAYRDSTTVLAGVDYGNRYSAGLARQPTAQRGSTLAQAVQSTNRRCSPVTRADYKGSFEQRAFWAVRCGTSDYLVTIARDGAVKAETCAVQETYGPGCWVDWE
jgi:hypothetical protein